jgi:hypothetical protein
MVVACLIGQFGGLPEILVLGSVACLRTRPALHINHAAIPTLPGCLPQEPGQKIVDSETAAQMLQLVLPGGRFVEPFCAFLTQQKDYKKVNADQWSK